MIYSIVETAKENGLDPYNYPWYVLKKAPNMDIRNPDHLETLYHGLQHAFAAPPSDLGGIFCVGTLGLTLTSGLNSITSPGRKTVFILLR
ncbi:transposase domain-containing protein [Ruminococcaceae bacterium OttesenSCG-928-D13]|nr:transposase domain-containing protein [Ruminococcaceae bacterium OttesenSCG-928-D13]